MKEFKPEGSTKAKIALIGESLGEEEAAEGRPFVGSAGGVLNSQLAQAGINRDECYIDNLYWFWPDSRKKNQQMSDRFDQAQYDLMLRLKSVDANVVVPIGDWALRAITGMEGITNYRGSILKAAPAFGERKAIPILHPSFIQRGNWKYFNVSVADLVRIRKEAESPVIHTDVENFIFHTNPSFPQVMDFIHSIDKNELLSVDIETKPALAQIVCVGLAQGTEAMSIPIFNYRKPNNNHFFIDEEVEIWRALWLILSDPAIDKIFQNYMYDAYYFTLYGIEINGYIWDTMLMHHTIYQELPHGLGFLTSIYTTIPYYKKEGKEWDARRPMEQLWRYNCLDVLGPVIIQREIKAELEELNLLRVYDEFQQRSLKPYLKKLTRGMLVDKSWLGFLGKENEEKIIVLQNKLDTLAGKHINVKSPKQLAHYFYVEKNVPARFSRKTGNLTFDKKARARIQRTYDIPELDLISAIIKLRDRQSRFFNMTIDVDGALRSSNNPSGTTSGRSSASKTPIGTGLNDQNVDRNDMMRSVFVARPGKKLVIGDLEQAEARVVAWLALEPTLMERFRRKLEVYGWFAMKFLNRDELVPKKDPWRQVFKKTAHASHYGMGAETMSEDLESEMGIHVTKSECQTFLDWYFATCPNIRSVFHRSIQAQIREKRKLTTPLGHSRWFLGALDDATFREGYSFIPQRTVAGIIRRGMQILAKRWDIIQEGHDALILEVDDDKAEEAANDMDMALEVPLIINGEELIIPREIKIYPSWGGWTYDEKKAYIEKVRNSEHDASKDEITGDGLLKAESPGSVDYV